MQELVQKLKWESLHRRRQVADLALFYKIQRNIVRIPFPAAVAPTPLESTRHNHHFHKLVPQATLNAFKYSFFIRTIPLWNGLTLKAVTAGTIEQFNNLAMAALKNQKNRKNCK